jgi:hypothetical protein
MALQIFIKVPDINVTEIRLVEAAQYCANGWTDMMEVTDTYSYYANEPKNQTMLHIKKYFVIEFCLLPGGRNCLDSSSSSPECNCYQISSSTIY